LTSIRVLAAVIQRGDQYLVCQRPLEKRHGGLWEFPGGKIEAGETDLEAASRELAEELGVAVSELGRTLFSIADEGSHFQIEFIPARIQGEPQTLEHMEIRWLRLSDLSSIPLAPSDHRFVEFLLLQSAPATDD
jgi:8-oxo-dGTP diphosphatase